MRGTRNRTSAPAEVEEEEEIQETSGGLQFNEPLSWRAGKAIPVGDLLRRLQTLSQELRGLDQEEVSREDLVPIAKELAADNLLSHKDKGVRAWTACCLVDMFRLCAPDAPYTGPQLKKIFTVILTGVFPVLADPSNPYNGQHLYILKSLAEVKSIVLLTDIPSAGDLIMHLFSTCFDVLSGPSKAESGEELSKNVEHHMTAVLATLIDESQGLGGDVVDVLLAQFLRADPRALAPPVSKGKKTTAVDGRQSTLLLKEAPPAYNMAKNICNSCPDKMARYISQYFSNVIVAGATATLSAPSKHKSHKRNNDDLGLSDDEGPSGPSEEDLQESQKAHRLLRELWRSAPGVLQEIIPHLEAELGAEDVQLRLLATETLGDMISGVGAAGPPIPPTLNPVAYPSQSLISPSEKLKVYNFLTTPNSPYSFPSRHPQAYQSFLGRKNDQSPVIRAAWATSIGRILMTSAGGVGLDSDEEQKLLKHFAMMLVDGDERVRLAAVKAIEKFDFHDIVQKLGGNGGMSESGSVLANLADRVREQKHSVRVESIRLLSRIWGVAAGAIAEGSERVHTLLGPIPSKILDTIYINKPEINALVMDVLFESLLPLGYPPIKPTAATSQSQAVKESQANGESALSELDIDRIRAERELILLRDLDEKSKKVLFALQSHRVTHSKYMEVFLARCEEYNGGVMDKGEKETTQKLRGLVDHFSKMLPEPARAVDDLWKFAKAHDRRNYQLIRFSMASDSDYRKVHRAIKELLKRLEESFGTGSTVIETVKSLVYRVGNLLYNRSHVPAIMEYSRSDEKGLGQTAHIILQEISEKNADVFKVHVADLCKALEADTPTEKKPNSPGAVQNLKACVAYARKFPKDLSKDRKFFQSMLGYALYGSPPEAAKHAVTIIMTSAEKKEMYAKDIIRKSTKGFQYGSGHYLTKLASLSQLTLLGRREIEDDIDTVIDIAINSVLLNQQGETQLPDDPEWKDDLDEHCQAKLWALRILVNRLRGLEDGESNQEAAEPVYKLLNTLVAKQGELSKTADSPKFYRSRLRLFAAERLLKLSCKKQLDPLLTLKAFNQLATMAQDPLSQVRSHFVRKLMKYLGQDKLPRRFYAIIFLLAFEPDDHFKESAITWCRARATAFASKKEFVMEGIFARFLSLLAHHPDYDVDVNNLRDFVQYIIFYLKSVANSENLPLIYHIAQRVKGIRDGINPEMSDNLYLLSDLSQAVIKRWEEFHGWSMQAFPGKMKMPAGIFAVLPSHDVAQDIANKQYVPEELVDELDDLVKNSLKSKKRKSEVSHAGHTKKRTKTSSSASSKPKSLPVRKPIKTPKVRKIRDEDAVPSSERRRSGRQSAHKSYVERSDGEDDEEMADVPNDEDEEMSDTSEEEEIEEQASEEEVEEQPLEEEVEEYASEKEDAAEEEKAAEVSVQEEAEDNVEEADDASEEEVEEEYSSPPPAPSGRGRGTRAPARRPPKEKEKPAVSTPKAKAKGKAKATPKATPTSARSDKAKAPAHNGIATRRSARTKAVDDE